MKGFRRYLAFLSAVLLVLAGLSSPAAAKETGKNEPVTRVEFVKQLVTHLGIDLQDAKDLPFKDVEEADKPYVEAALRTNITTGKGPDRFGPNEKLTREQAYVFLIRALNLKDSYDPASLGKYKDSRAVMDIFKGHLAAADQLGLMEGFTNHTIQPRKPVTQQQVDAMLKRFDSQFDIISIIHTNDTHGRLLHNEKNKEMGFAKISEIIKQTKAQHPTFVFDSGDTMHGTNYVILKKGDVVVDVLNALPIDAMVAGNHDFNYNQDRLLELKEKAKFPIISANIMKEGKPFLPGHTIIEKGGKTFAVIGLTATDTQVKTHPSGIKGITFNDEVETAKQKVEELKGKADHIIAITHAGVETDEKVAEQVEGIDLIIGGHSHTTIETPKKLKHAYVTQAHEHTKTFGKLNMMFHKDKLIGVNGFLYRDSADKKKDERINEIIAPYKAEADKLLQEVIGTTEVDLVGDRKFVRVEETNLGNLIADAMRSQMATDIAFENGGGIRASIAKGEVKRQDVVTTLPFDNTLVKTKLTGAEIVKALEHSVRMYPEENGGFLHVSGMTFSFDPSKKAYERVSNVQIGGQPIQADKVYTVATNDFTAVGGDGYDMFGENKIDYNSNELLSEVLIKYFQDKKPIPAKEGRITVIK